MNPLDLTKIYKKYRGKWVALKNEKEIEVVACGKSLEEALDKASAKGLTKPLITKIPQKVTALIG